MNVFSGNGESDVRNIAIGTLLAAQLTALLFIALAMKETNGNLSERKNSEEDDNFKQTNQR